MALSMPALWYWEYPTEHAFRSSELVTPSLAYLCAYRRLAEQKEAGRTSVPDPPERPSPEQHDSSMEKARSLSPCSSLRGHIHPRVFATTGPA